LDSVGEVAGGLVAWRREWEPDVWDTAVGEAEVWDRLVGEAEVGDTAVDEVDI
jgi:hypothetical protein